nr:hypothetical protein BaRGS_007276 [Batillaria attramentaria]
MWRQDVKNNFPDMHRKVTFVPPVHFNRVSVKQETIHGEEVNVQIPAKQLSDVRENECTHRMHHTLRCMFEEEEEAMFVVWNLDFDTYLNNLGGLDKPKKTPSHRAESLNIPNGICRSDPSTPNGRVSPKNGHIYNAGFLRPRDLKPDLQRGKFAVLIISKHHGLVIIEIKAIGDAFVMAEESMTKEKEHNSIKTKIQKALSQLDKEETVLKYLVSDLSRDLPIKKALALPNLKRTKLEEVLLQDSELRNDFCRCFGTGQDVEAALRCCVFSEQLPPFGRAWELQDGDVKKLRQDWWLLLADNGGRQQLDDDLYESLVARLWVK